MKGEELLRVIEQLDDKIINEAETYETSQISKNVSWIRLGNLVACLVVCLLAVSVLGGAILGFYTKSSNLENSPENIYSNLNDNSQEVYSGMSEEVAQNAPEAEDVTRMDGSFQNEIVQEDDYHTEEEINTENTMDNNMDAAEGEKPIVTIEYSESEGGFILIQTYWNRNLPEVKYTMPEKGSYYYFVQLEDALTYYEEQENIKYYVEICVFGDYWDDNNQLVYGELTGADREKNEQVQVQVQEERTRLQELGYEVEWKENMLQGYLSREQLEGFPIDEQYGYAFKLKNE